MSEQKTSSFEAFLYALIGVVVVIAAFIAALVMVLGEWVILALALLVGFGSLYLILWAGSAFFTWLWRLVAFTELEIEQKRQDMAIQAATTKQLLLLEDKRSNLVYAQDGFVPVSYDSIVAANTDRLLELVAQRVKTLQTPENVPNTFHYHVVTDTENTLNGPLAHVTGNVGGLDALASGQTDKRLKMIDGGESVPVEFESEVSNEQLS